MEDKNLDLIKFEKNRNKRLTLIFLGILSLSTSFLGILFNLQIKEFISINEKVIIIFSLVLLLIGLIVLFRVFLLSRPIEIFRNEYKNSNLNSFFDYHLKKYFIDKHGSQYRISEESKKEKVIFENELKILKEEYVKQTQEEIKYSHLFQDLNNSEKKINSEIERLKNNSNLNLIIGSFTTLIAVLLLVYTLSNKINFEKTADFFVFFIPRFSTVVFLEIFSFFFLKQYKSNLNEIKYFQNEITNLNFKITALKTALKADKESLSLIICEFSKTERNFVLKKDETTEKIEALKMDSDSPKLIETLNKIIEKIK